MGFSGKSTRFGVKVVITALFLNHFLHHVGGCATGDVFVEPRAEDVRARVTQPPADLSAMDGYAVRADDVAQVPATLKVVRPTLRHLADRIGSRLRAKALAGRTVTVRVRCLREG